MSNKSERKQLREFRRAAGRAGLAYHEALTKKLGVFNEALRPCPKLCPRALWRGLSAIFVDVKKLEKAVLADPTLR